MSIRPNFGCFLCLMLVAGSFRLVADEFDFSEDEPIAQEQAELESDEPAWSIPIHGKLSLDLGRQTQQPKRWIEQGVSAHLTMDWPSDWGLLRGEGSLIYNRAYRAEDDPDDLRRKYELDSTLRELYWSHSLGAHTLTLGRRIVVLGQGDFLSVLDIVSPSDQSKLFFSDPEEARIGQDLLMVEKFFGQQKVALIVSPSPRFNRLPDHGHPYQLVPNHRSSEDDVQPEGVFVLRQDMTPLSLSWILGRVHQRDPMLTLEGMFPSLVGTYEPYTVAGLGVSYSFSEWLMKAELASYGNYAWQQYTPGLPPTKVERSTTAVMLGADYIHDTYGSWTIEGNLIRPQPSDDDIKTRAVYAISWSDSFFHEDLSISLTHLGFDKFKNQLNRFGIQWKLSDNWQLHQQYTHILIGEDDSPFKAVENADRLDFNILYSF